MSMRSWSEQGYGIPLFDGSEKQFDQVKRFLADNLEDLQNNEEAKQAVLSTEYECDLYESLDRYCCPAEAVAECFNNIFNTNVFGGYADCGETDQEAMVGIFTAYPWFKYKNAPKSEDEAKELVKKAGELIGITEDPDYFDAEYYG